MLYDTYMIFFVVENIFNFTDHICAAIIFVAHQTFAKIGFDRVFYLSGPVEFPCGIGKIQKYNVYICYRSCLLKNMSLFIKLKTFFRSSTKI